MKMEQELQKLLLYQKMIKVNTNTLGEQSVLFFTKKKGKKKTKNPGPPENGFVL